MMVLTYNPLCGMVMRSFLGQVYLLVEFVVPAFLSDICVLWNDAGILLMCLYGVVEYDNEHFDEIMIFSFSHWLSGYFAG